MPTNDSENQEQLSKRGKFAWFARGATITGWVALVAVFVLMRLSAAMNSKPAGPQCGLGAVAVLAPTLVFYTGCQGLGAVLSCAALLVPKSTNDGRPGLWLSIALTSFALSLALVLAVWLGA